MEPGNFVGSFWFRPFTNFAGDRGSQFPGPGHSRGSAARRQQVHGGDDCHVICGHRQGVTRSAHEKGDAHTAFKEPELPSEISPPSNCITNDLKEMAFCVSCLGLQPPTGILITRGLSSRQRDFKGDILDKRRQRCDLTLVARRVRVISPESSQGTMVRRPRTICDLWPIQLPPCESTAVLLRI